MNNKLQTPKNNMTMLSKKLSWLLRHGAIKEGLTIDADGFVKVDDILKHENYKKCFSMQVLQQLVEMDAKKRYTIRKNPLMGDAEIRANQGHSLKEVEEAECLTRILEPDEVTMAVHGTYYRNWPSIKRQGLLKMSRNHIHFASSDSGTDNISGFRHDCQLLIYLNVQKIFADSNLTLYRSDNNVILCRGLENGSIPPQYFAKVIDRRTGKSYDNLI